MSRAQAIELVRNGNRFLVTCHRRPDADALGSAIGFAEVLRKLGKEASVFSPDEPAASIAFLPGIYDVLRTIPAGTAPFDATFVTDTASGSLLPKGLPAHDVTGPIVALDHHVSFDDFADVVVRDDSMAATGELVLDMAVELGVRPSDLSLEGATCLYAALVADTGGFRYACTRSRTLRFAAELLDMGVDPWRVASNLFEHWAPERLQLLQAALAGMELNFGNRFALLTVTQDMLKATGATSEMIDGLVNYARKVHGVEVAALLWEQDAASSDLGNVPSTRVSFRAAGDVDVAKLAASLGGGGHRAASAATLPVDVATAKSKLFDAARALFA